LRPKLLLVLNARKEPIQRFVDLSEKIVDDKGSAYRITTVHRAGEFGIDLGQYYDLIAKSFN
jgi:hypothetical protein